MQLTKIKNNSHYLKLTADSLTIDEMVEYLKIYQLPHRTDLSISGIHVDSKNQKMWVTLGEKDRYREVSVIFSDWVRWVRSKRLNSIGI